MDDQPRGPLSSPKPQRENIARLAGALLQIVIHCTFVLMD